MRIEARLDRVDGFKTRAKGTLCAADGTVCAEGTGLFILPHWLREKSVDEVSRARQHDATQA